MKVSFYFQAEPAKLATLVIGELVVARNGPFNHRDLGYYEEPNYAQAVMTLVKHPFIRRPELVEQCLSQEQQEEILRLWYAIAGWASGEEAATYLWHVTDDHYPVDDGVRVDNATFETWVNNSRVKIHQFDGGWYHFEASGTRHSFAENHTGKIAEAVVDLAVVLTGVTDLMVESQAAQPWDNELKNLFRPTRLAQVKRALLEERGLERALLGGIQSQAVHAAAKLLLLALGAEEAGREHTAEKERRAVWRTAAPSSDDEFVEVTGD